jgi:hypothetical protein
MTRIEVIESFVQEVPCFICLQVDFQVTLNCELPDQVCDHIAECKNCGHKALITEIASGLNALSPKIKGLAERQGCLICQDSNLLVDYICDNGSKDYFYFARCLNEKHYMIINANGIQYLFE